MNKLTNANLKAVRKLYEFDSNGGPGSKKKSDAIPLAVRAAALLLEVYRPTGKDSTCVCGGTGLITKYDDDKTVKAVCPRCNADGKNPPLPTDRMTFVEPMKLAKSLMKKSLQKDSEG